MPIDIESLLAPVSAEQPCGPDLEYDADFMALETAVKGKPEQVLGATVVAAEEPIWADIRSQAQGLFKRTKDVRAGVLLVRALARTEDLAGLNQGLLLLHAMLERYWDGAHPLLDAADNNDPTMRLNALAPLADSENLLRDARLMTVVRVGPQKPAD